MKIETYIVFMADYLGIEDYPLHNLLAFSKDYPLEQVLRLNHKIIADFERILQLQFIEKTTVGNVCFASQNSELQDDFKQVFTQKDLLDYFYAVISLPGYQQLKLEKYYPKNTNEFWNLVREAEKLKVRNHKR